MHCNVLTMSLLAGSIAVPGYLGLRLRSVLELNRATKPRGSKATGVSLPAERPVSRYAERWVERAFDARDRKLVAILKGELSPGARILEVGCGEGRLLAVLKEEGFEVFGLDIDPHAAEIAGRRVGAGRVQCGDMLETWGAEERVDAVLFCDSLRYTTHPHRLLRRALSAARLTVVTEPYACWHALGRLVFLRFLYRVGHLSRLRPEVSRVARLHRTLWHRIHVFRASAKPPSPSAVLLEEGFREEKWFSDGIIHPAIVGRIENAALASTATAVAMSGALIAHLLTCSAPPSTPATLSRPTPALPRGAAKIAVAESAVFDPLSSFERASHHPVLPHRLGNAPPR